MAKTEAIEAEIVADKSGPVPVKRGSELTSYDDLMAYLNKARQEASTDPEAIERRIFEDMLGAETPDELFGPTTIIKSSDLYNVPIVIHDVTFMASDFGDNNGLYMILTATVQGERVKISNGARTPMMQCLIAREKGWFPLTLMFQKSIKATDSGFFPVNLVPYVAEESF